MGFRTGSVFTTTLVNTALPAADTIVLQTPPLSPPADNVQILIWWFLQLATGAGGTAITWKLSRGTAIGAPLLTSGVLGTVASVNAFIVGCFPDSPGVTGGVQYNLAINDNGAAGTAQLGSMIALAL